MKSTLIRSWQHASSIAPRSKSTPQSCLARGSGKRYLVRIILTNSSFRTLEPSDWSLTLHPTKNYLPAETLTKILSYAADETVSWREHYAEESESRKYVSTHLFKARLINKTFADVGFKVFLDLAKDDKFRHYRSIVLPSSLSIADATTMLRNSAYPLTSLIDTVDFRVYIVFQEGLSKDYLFELMNCTREQDHTLGGTSLS